MTDLNSTFTCSFPTTPNLSEWIIGIVTLVTVILHVIIYTLKKYDISLPVLSASTDKKKTNIINIQTILNQLQTDIKAISDSSSNGNGSTHSVIALHP